MIRILFSVLISVSTVCAFDGDRAFSLVETLGSDAFGGRRPGFPGFTKAENFVIEEFRRYGVDPAGESGYRQPVPLLVTEEQAAALTIMNHELGKIPFHLGADFTVVTHSGSGAFVAPMVVVGYGYDRPDKGRNDYSDFDVNGKIVLIIRGKPDSPFDFEEDFPRRHGLEWARQRGAAAVLWHQEGSLLNGAAIPANSYDPAMPLLYVSDRFVRLMLDGTGYNYNSYLKKLKKEPAPLTTVCEAWISVRTRKLADATASNIIGMVYGTDPVLKNELIVIGGHLDHIGANANGVIYNGADDNGSGSSVVMELARNIAERPLKRSVVFALFTGEEDGLLGSDYFVKNPPIPFGNIIAMLNFDMEGQGNGRVGVVGGELLGRVWRDYTSTLDSTELAVMDRARSDGEGASDHASFMEGGAPAVAFWSSGDHIAYHRYTDDPGLISRAALQAVGDRAEHLTRYLGDIAAPLAFRSDSLRILARISDAVDLRGVSIDPSGNVADFRGISAAWLPGESSIPVGDLLRRMYEFENRCATKSIVADGLAKSLTAHRSQKNAAFIAIPESGITTRAGAEVMAMAKQGLSVVQLPPSSSRGASSEPAEGVRAARDAGAYALIPFDFSAPARIDYWKDHGIVVSDIPAVADAPEDVRTGLLTGESFVLLNVTSVPTSEQLAALYPFRARYVHLNFGSVPESNREAIARSTIETMYAAGYKRSDILMATGRNLRRYLANSDSHAGQGHD